MSAETETTFTHCSNRTSTTCATAYLHGVWWSYAVHTFLLARFVLPTLDKCIPAMKTLPLWHDCFNRTQNKSYVRKWKNACPGSLTGSGGGGRTRENHSQC